MGRLPCSKVQHLRNIDKEYNVLSNLQASKFHSFQLGKKLYTITQTPRSCKSELIAICSGLFLSSRL
uniref:Uncharacterized protein n=1 Tax=Trichobilharzia regenti TaxID=157069 RepID=A0AA85JMF9_TRIRE|nr:unnamed protein product [Trichobilharzia regenti]